VNRHCEQSEATPALARYRAQRGASVSLIIAEIASSQKTLLAMTHER
jgi:hypothetical protein